MSLDKTRIATTVLSVGLGLAVSIYGHSLIAGNKDAINLIVTVFSILSGFLISIITIIGDPSIVASRNSWRFTQLNKKNVRRRLLRNKVMFTMYLLTLFLIFVSTVLSGFPLIKEIVERAFIFFAVTAFLLSFSLPWSLTKIQMDRYQELLEDQRSKASKIDKN